MNNYTNLTGREDLLESITILEKELAAKTGKEVAMVAYSQARCAGSLFHLNQKTADCSSGTGLRFLYCPTLG